MKTTQHLALAALLALSTLSGAALAGPMPVGGEGPLVLDQPLVSTTSRAEVRAEALAHPPVHGGQSMFADAPVARTICRPVPRCGPRPVTPSPTATSRPSAR